MPIEKTDPRKENSNPAILIIALLVFGLVLGGFGLYRYNTGKESMSWPAVRGKITYARAAPRRVNKTQQYQTTVRYSYAVSGRSYNGQRITASDVYQKTLSGAKDILRKYPVGGEVSVYYDPADPGMSLLETGTKKNVFVLLGAAAGCFLLAVAIAVSYFKKKRS